MEEKTLIPKLVIEAIFVIILIYFTVRCGIRIQREYRNYSLSKIQTNEIYVLGVMPWIGYGLLLLFWEAVELLDWKYIGSIIVINILSILLYFLSRLTKHKLGPITLALIPMGLISGIFLFSLMLYHFSFAALLMIVMEPYTLFLLPYIALIQAIILFLFELISILRFNKVYYAKHSGKYGFITRKLYFIYLGKYGLIAQLLTFPIFVFVVQFAFVVFTKRFDNFYQAFRESEFGLLSKGECEHCTPIDTGGTDYICTIAAHGHPRLVKPVFMGQRHGRFIPVNRQLQVCNAFEELLAEQFPRLQKVLRKVYDRLQIPVDRWKHSGLISNLLYVLIKPLEWSFLFYLYAFDPSPEKRIGRQYRSKAIHGVE